MVKNLSLGRHTETSSAPRSGQRARRPPWAARPNAIGFLAPSARSTPRDTV